MRSSLQPALHRAQLRLDKLPPGAVILDGRGHAWQHGGPQNPYWYRAFGNDSFISEWELTQIIEGKFTVIHPSSEAT